MVTAFLASKNAVFPRKTGKKSHLGSCGETRGGSTPPSRNMPARSHFDWPRLSRADGVACAGTTDGCSLAQQRRIVKTFGVLIAMVLMAGTPNRLSAADVKLETRGPRPTLPGLKLGASIDRPFVLDHRFSPSNWQTAICLPDDWQKTLVGKDGAMLYDYPGDFAGFGTRITVDLVEPAVRWTSQRLEDPRTPVVITTFRAPDVEFTAQEFAVTDAAVWPSPPSQRFQTGLRPRGIERVGNHAPQPNWVRPVLVADACFADVDVGHAAPLRYRMKADRDKRYTIVFGLCEGHWHQPGHRVLQLKVEGQVRDTIDPVAAAGHGVPFVRAVEAKDADEDGWLDIEIGAAPHAADENTILNVLWVFDRPPSLGAVLRGEETPGAVGYLPAMSDAPTAAPPRADLLIAAVRNEASAERTIQPRVRVQSRLPLRHDAETGTVWISGQPVIRFSDGLATVASSERELVCTLPTVSLKAGAAHRFALAFHRSADAVTWSVDAADRALAAARRCWRDADLPYDRLKVPDPAVQALLDSSIRNIYQAREIKDGLPAFQVGPTCYRGLWVVDGAFLLEAMSLLDRGREARAGVQYMLAHQKPDGSFELLEKYWKETGIVLWVIDRHEQLTGDRAWLQGVWPRVEKAAAFIHELRRRASADPNALHAGLVPPGFSDGGLAGAISEYTNVYWILVGLKSAAAMAERLGKAGQAEAWRREYRDMWNAFRKAARRDLYTDAFGNRMLPVPMKRPLEKAPHKALWAFCHAIYPGEIFEPDDAVMLGTLASLTDNECEGLVRGTGWLDAGIWNYFGSFYGHAFAWLGEGRKAAEILYAFGNHASPLLAWREEQNPRGGPEQICGDMPHNWASAEFIRLTAHLLCLERDRELHLLEGLPPTWLKPGFATELNGIQTRFGPVSLTLRISADARTATLDITPPTRTPPDRIVVHRGTWASSLVHADRPLQDGKEITVPASAPIRLLAQLHPALVE